MTDGSTVGRRLGRSFWAATLTLALIVGAAPQDALSQAGGASRPKIERRVLDRIADKGRATFWVVLRDRANLSRAPGIRDWKSRGAFVHDQLRRVADRSQAGLRSLLRSRGVDHQPFWIVNAIRVTAGQEVLDEIASRPEVAEIRASRRYSIPEPTQPKRKDIDAVEWNIERIRAPEVWDGFGVRGEGVVVANIDTGVQFDHPALVAQYRGNLGGGSFDHNYNWWDPSEVCGDPEPCDNIFHGTHTMGTMIGDDGDPGTNQIGAAPHAKWIAAKGCEEFFCSDFALLSSGQWVLAPTDLNGDNPRPDLRPQVVNNSWGTDDGSDTFYQATVQAWVASGIFPAFANGNAGDFCGTVGAPASYPESYGVGAHDIGNDIAGFSSRGPSPIDDGTKPDITAPGVDVRSAVPGDSYESFDGTSMATPHLAGTVALMWSAAPALFGDIAGTRAILDDSAIDTPDDSCGGTDDDNNVWGEGRLDAFAAVDQSPRGPTGTLAGTVTDASTGDPIAGATIHAVGPSDRTTTTDPSGNYSLLLPVGTYDVTASAFGYLPETASGVEILEDQTTTQDFALDPAPTHTVSGHVRDGDGAAIEGATVTILGTPIPPATTDADGFYSFDSVPEGEYDVEAEVSGCNESQTQHLVVDGDETLDFVLPQRVDGYGYFCELVPFDYIAATNELPLSGDDDVMPVDLPFPFTLYGRTYDTTHVATNGFMNFLSFDARFDNESIPDPNEPNGAIYPYWDDLVVDGAAGVFTETLGEAPDRRFVIEWRNVRFFDDNSRRVGFEVVLNEDGSILAQYTDIAEDDGKEQGNSATVGIEDDEGSIAFEYSFNRQALSTGLAVLWNLPPSGFVEGQVTDATDGMGVEGATVRALQGETEVRSTSTDLDGFYRMQLPLGTYTVEAAKQNYGTESAEVTLDEEREVIIQDFVLPSSRAVIRPGALNFLLVEGKTRTKTLRLRNVGQLDLTFEIDELPVGDVEGGGARLPQGVDSRTAPKGYAPKAPQRRILVGGPVLVFMDALPWDSEALLQVLEANEIPFDLASSDDMGSIDLSGYEVVFLSSDQPQSFYDNYADNVFAFEDYVLSGGFLWVGAAAWGFNEGDFDGGVLPGGATVVGPAFEDFNDVIDPEHPTMQGVPDPFFGTFASHAAFENMPDGTNVIATGQDSGLPTLIEYEVGAGRVLAFGQTLEYGFEFGEDAGRILENGVPYAYEFEPGGLDVPWLSEQPVEGTVPPGRTQTINVTVDTTGLEPGLYRARLRFRTNDPRNPSLQIPVTLIVPAYLKGVEVGGLVRFVDREGEVWARDRAWRRGSWGFWGDSRRLTTRREIRKTLNDPLYQTARLGLGGVLEYRFDGLVSGVYQVHLNFAEIRGVRAGERLYDVILENDLVLPAHDIAAEVGRWAADRHVFFIEVTDGQLRVRFIHRLGFKRPIVNAIRVVHRPDL
jgi:hypothetical protein